MTRRKAYTFILLFNCYLTSATYCVILLYMYVNIGIDEQTQRKERARPYQQSKKEEPRQNC